MKKIIFIAVPLLLIILAFNRSGSLKVTGKITDDKGQAIPFATVQEKGTKNGTVSDANGGFSITVKSEKSTLVFSAVGFISQEVAVNSHSTLNIALAASSAQMQEVVVTAMGIKGRLKEIGDVNTQTFYSATGSALAGKAPGISINNFSTNSNDYLWSDKKIAPNGSGNIKSDSTEFNTEGYDKIVDNPFLRVTDNPLSTFSIDVDAASYSNIRRFLNNGELPPAGAVRIEEMINYFHYEYPQPQGNDPFTVNTETSDCPWNAKHKLVLVGLQGKKIPIQNLPSSNLVFLIDVSGSMDEPDKLPLVQESLKLLVDQLRQDDRVAIVVYAGNAGLVLPSTNGSEKIKIKDAIASLEAGGSTAGGEGIKLAYKIAKQNFIQGGNNRVILCTDGDFNVGVSSDDQLASLIENERKSGVFLSVLGFGTGNYQDSKMQKLADKGNGNHSYIDELAEAKKVFVNEFGGTLFTIAKDVKLQIEFNPTKVQGYRLLGYENRLLNKEDFNDDKKDAGELGSGHTVTALYEVIPVGVKDDFLKSVDPLKYQTNLSETAESGSDEIMNIKLRYKQPDGDVSKLIEQPVYDKQNPLTSASDNFRFAASVAEFGMLLRQSEYKSNSNFASVLNLANSAKGKDDEGYRSEFIHLISKAQNLAKGKNYESSDDELKKIAERK